MQVLSTLEDPLALVSKLVEKVENNNIKLLLVQFMLSTNVDKSKSMQVEILRSKELSLQVFPHCPHNSKHSDLNFPPNGNPEQFLETSRSSESHRRKFIDV